MNGRRWEVGEKAGGVVGERGAGGGRWERVPPLSTPSYM